MHTRAFALLSLLVAAGCGPHRYLVWNPMPPAPTMGRVAILVADRRDPKRGGEDPGVVGMQRDGWGIPHPIRIGPPGQLSMDMHDLLTDAALAAGVGVVPPGQEATAPTRMMVDIQNFWCDGFWPVWKGGVVLAVTIVDAATNQVRVPAMPLQAEESGGNCRDAFRKALNIVYPAAQAMFASPQIHAALVAGGPPPGGPPPGAPPPPPGAPPPPPAQ